MNTVVFIRTQKYKSVVNNKSYITTYLKTNKYWRNENKRKLYIHNREEKDFILFLNITSGSLAEIETQLVIAERIGYITFSEDLQNKITTIRKMLYRLKQSLNKKLSK